MRNPFRRGDPGYVNPGPDWRFSGLIGMIAGRIQRQSLFYSTTPPTRVFFREGEWGRIALYDPWFFAIFLKRDDGPWWWSFRIGYRWDPFVGDGNNPKEPVHDPPGAYFLDVIAKPKIDHIVGN